MPHAPVGKDTMINVPVMPSLRESFEKYREPEDLGANNKWFCPKCDEHKEITKKIEIYKAPPVLLVNLKRFKEPTLA